MRHDELIGTGEPLLRVDVSNQDCSIAANPDIRISAP